ncbi:hypothetical protein RK21_00530 [Pseudomonas plecoglossicida]|nr:hypothetical protein RK21_00530 [Pseudomonas plecoglossicida]
MGRDSIQAITWAQGRQIALSDRLIDGLYHGCRSRISKC